MQSAALFTKRPTYQCEIRRVVQFIDAFLARDAAGGEHDLPATTRNACNLLRIIDGLRQAAWDAAQFFEPANLDRVARWATRHRMDGRTYAAAGQRLVATRTSGLIDFDMTLPAARFDAARFDALQGHATAWTERLAEQGGRKRRGRGKARAPAAAAR